MDIFRIYGVLFLMVLATSLANGQKGERVVGYILDSDNQKREGYIEVLGELNREVKVKFSEKKSAKKYSTIKIKDLNGYGFLDQTENEFVEEGENWRHFVKYEFERPAKVFATNESLIEVVVSDGYYTVYKFLFESGGDVKMPVTTRYVILKDGEEVVQIEEENFEKEVKILFADYTALHDSIGEKKFRFTSLVRLTDDYNFWKEAQHDPNIYKLNPKIYNQ
jgi:hypothetical protein